MDRLSRQSVYTTLDFMGYVNLDKAIKVFEVDADAYAQCDTTCYDYKLAAADSPSLALSGYIQFCNLCPPEHAASGLVPKTIAVDVWHLNRAQTRNLSGQKYTTAEAMKCGIKMVGKWRSTQYCRLVCVVAECVWRFKTYYPFEIFCDRIARARVRKAEATTIRHQECERKHDVYVQGLCQEFGLTKKDIIDRSHVSPCFFLGYEYQKLIMREAARKLVLESAIQAVCNHHQFMFSRCLEFARFVPRSKLYNRWAVVCAAQPFNQPDCTLFAMNIVTNYKQYQDMLSY